MLMILCQKVRNKRGRGGQVPLPENIHARCVKVKSAFDLFSEGEDIVIDMRPDVLTAMIGYLYSCDRSLVGFRGAKRFHFIQKGRNGND